MKKEGRKGIRTVPVALQLEQYQYLYSCKLGDGEKKGKNLLYGIFTVYCPVVSYPYSVTKSARKDNMKHRKSAAGSFFCQVDPRSFLDSFAVIGPFIVKEGGTNWMH